MGGPQISGLVTGLLQAASQRLGATADTQLLSAVSLRAGCSCRWTLERQKPGARSRNRE